MINKPFSWSYSTLDAFDTCPLQLREVRLMKRYSDRNQFNIAGTADHGAVENRIQHGQPLPPQMTRLEPVLDRLLQIPGRARAELELAVTEQWQPTGWFAKDAWGRAKLDLAIINPASAVASVFDWKTGKYRKTSRFVQLEISALLLAVDSAAAGVELNQFNTALVWTNDGFKVEPLQIRQQELSGIKDKITAKVEEYRKAYDADKFWPKQNGLCRRHCPVTTCKYNGKYEGR